MPETDYVKALIGEYQAITADPSRPFPRMDALPSAIPPEELLLVEVKSGFTALLEQSDPELPGAARLTFPEGTDDLVVPRSCVADALVDAAVAKVSHWLSNGRNAAYAEAKLLALMHGNEPAVRRMIEDAALRPRTAAAHVQEPDELEFRFWTYLANLILSDLKQKKEKTTDDHGACQSAWIIGYVVFWRKGKRMQEQERATDLKHLETLVRKPPHLFALEDLYDLRDPKGVPFSAKHTRAFIQAFIAEKTASTEEGHLPFLVRLAAEGHQYFVQRDLVAPVFLAKATESSTEARDHYLEDWVSHLKRFEHTPPMRSEEAFRRDVEGLVAREFPLLAALGNAPLLLAARGEPGVTEAVRTEVGKCIRRDGSLRPMADIIGLSRQKLLREARSYLPMWMTTPVIREIGRLLQGLFHGGRRRPRPSPTLADEERARNAAEAARLAGARRRESAAGAPARAPAAAAAPAAARGGPIARDPLARYKQAIAALRERAVPEGSTLEGVMADLAAKWNPLYEEQQQRNLVEDVNALARDFLRSLRRGFLVRPPTLERLHELAQRLATSRTLEKIKKKEPLARYLELYFIKCLQVIR